MGLFIGVRGYWIIRSMIEVDLFIGSVDINWLGLGGCKGVPFFA